MKKIFLMTLMGIAMALPAGAVDFQWQGEGSNCLTMDASFYFCKADNKWDVQKTEEALRPAKMVYHKGGANPVIWIIYDTAASASSASDYASKVRARYESRGIKDITVTKEVVGGKDIYVVSGEDSAKGARFSSALVWKSGMKKALQLEYTAGSVDFSTYQPQFMAVIQSIKDLR